MNNVILVGLLAHCMSTLSSPVPIESRALTQRAPSLDFAGISHDARATSEKHSMDRREKNDTWSTQGNPEKKKRRDLDFAEISRDARSTSENHSMDRREEDDTWSTDGNAEEKKRRSLDFAEISRDARSTSEKQIMDRAEADDTWSTQGNPEEHKLQLCMNGIDEDDTCSTKDEEKL